MALGMPGMGIGGLLGNVLGRGASGGGMVTKSPVPGLELLSGLFGGGGGQNSPLGGLLGGIGGILPLIYLFSQLFGGDSGGDKKEPTAGAVTPAAAPSGVQPGGAPAPAPMQAAQPQPTPMPAWQQYRDPASGTPSGPGTPAAQQAVALQNQPGFFGQMGQALQDPGVIAMLGNMGGQLNPQGPMAGAGQYAAGVAQNKSAWDYQLDTLSKLFAGQSPGGPSPF